MLTYPYKGTEGKLTKEQKQQLEAELYNDKTQSLKQARDYVEKKFGVRYTTPGIRYVFQRLKVKKKTGRPEHEHKDYKGEGKFKKKFPAIKKQYGKRYYRSDEMRAGTRTECKSRWTPRGHRPVCKVKLGYEFCYLYAGSSRQEGISPSSLSQNRT